MTLGAVEVTRLSADQDEGTATARASNAETALQKHRESSTSRFGARKAIRVNRVSGARVARFMRN
jgi:hypothetical protein